MCIVLHKITLVYIISVYCARGQLKLKYLLLRDVKKKSLLELLPD